MSKQKESTAIEVNPRVMEVAGKTLLNIKGLAKVEPEVAKKVAELDGRLKNSLGKFGTTGLEIGQVLSELKMLLEPRRIWTYYLNTIPGFSQATAYRFISGYEHAQSALPKSVFDRVLASGLKMLPSKDAPYGKYTDAVNAVGKPKSNWDTGQVDEWLFAVEKKQQELSRRGVKKVVDANALQRDAYRSIVQKYAKVADGQQVQWIRNLFSYVMHDVGLAGPLSISPAEPPKYIRDTKEHEKVTEKAAS